MNLQTENTGGMVRRSIGIEVRGIDTDTRSVDVVASTRTIDSHGDIVEQDWRLDRYHRNPVVLWHHNQFDSSRGSMGGAVRPEDLLPIGRADNVRVVGDRLEARIVFASEDLNPLANKIYGLFREGMLRSVSVGFRPGRVSKDKAGDREIYRLWENELLEISVVTVPSNPDAVAKSLLSDREMFARLAGAEGAPDGAEGVHMEEDRGDVEKAAATQPSASEADADVRLRALESEIAALRAGAEDSVKALAAMREDRDRYRDQVVAQEIRGFVGSKIAPAEADQYTELAKQIGLDRVRSLLSVRPDLGLIREIGLPASSSAHVPVSGDESAGARFAAAAKQAVGV